MSEGLGVSTKEKNSSGKDGGGCSGEEVDGVAVGGLDCGGSGLRAVEALSAALGVGVGGEEEKKQECEKGPDDCGSMGSIGVLRLRHEEARAFAQDDRFRWWG